MTKPEGILIHHTAGRPEATVAAIDRVHREERRFSGGIGYHLLLHLATDGWRFDPGRPVGTPGAHCPGRQTWIGLAVAGDYERHELPAAARELLEETLVELCATHDIPVANILGHRDASRTFTLCPGAHLYAQLESIRQAVAARLPREEGPHDSP